MELKKPDQFRVFVITALGNSSITDSGTITAIIPYLFRDSLSSIASKNAIIKGDNLSIKLLSDKFKTSKLDEKIMIVKVLGEMDKFKDSISGLLEKWYKESSEIILKDAIEDAQSLL